MQPTLATATIIGLNLAALCALKNSFIPVAISMWSASYGMRILTDFSGDFSSNGRSQDSWRPSCSHPGCLLCINLQGRSYFPYSAEDFMDQPMGRSNYRINR